MRMLRTFSTMKDGHFGRINVAKHRIGPTSGATPVHSAPYCAGPKTCAFQHAEIAKMLEEKVIKPPTTGWATPIVFVAKTDKTFPFLVD